MKLLFPRAQAVVSRRFVNARVRAPLPAKPSARARPPAHAHAPPHLPHLSSTAMDIAAFAVSQLALIALEKNADIVQQASLTSQLPPAALVRHGLALTNLVPAGQRTGFGGRTLLDLEADTAIVADGKLPPHGVRQGDIVRVEVQPSGSATRKEKSDIKDAGVEGVVHRVFETKVSVAINLSSSDDDSAAVDRICTAGKRLWIVKLANEVTFNRMEQTMARLRDLGTATSSSPLVDVLFGKTDPTVPLELEEGDITWFDAGLNESQKEAVRFALASREVGIVTYLLTYSTHSPRC